MATTTATTTPKSSFWQKLVDDVLGFLTRVKPVIQKIEEATPIVEGIVGIALPEANALFPVVNAIAGHVFASLGDLDAAASAGFVNITLDGQLLQDAIAASPKFVSAAIAQHGPSVASVLGTVASVATEAQSLVTRAVGVQAVPNAPATA